MYSISNCHVHMFTHAHTSAYRSCGSGSDNPMLMVKCCDAMADWIQRLTCVRKVLVHRVHRTTQFTITHTCVFPYDTIGGKFSMTLRCTVWGTILKALWMLIEWYVKKKVDNKKRWIPKLRHIPPETIQVWTRVSPKQSTDLIVASVCLGRINNLATYARIHILHTLEYVTNTTDNRE